MHFLFVVMMSLFLVPAAFAQEEKKKDGPTINIQIPPDVSENNKVYLATLEKLKPEQKANAEKIVKVGGDIMMVYIEMLMKNIQMNGLCLPKKISDPVYGVRLKEVEAHMHAETQKTMEGYKKDVISKIDYMDPDVVLREIVGNNIIQNRLVTGMLKVAVPTMPPAKIVQDCRDAEKYLNNYGSMSGLF